MTRSIAPLACTAAMIGCGGGSPPIPVPKISPAAAAASAIERYDTDGDGTLSSEEIRSCPGLHAAASLYDKDGDASISPEEIVTRLASWAEKRIAIVSLTCKVTLNGRPLPGAEVKLVPEEYLGKQVNPARGKTTERGTAVVSVAKDVLPDGAQNFRGVNFGTYRVEVTHPSVEIPDEYRGPSTLGIEIAPDCGTPYASFELKS